MEVYELLIKDIVPYARNQKKHDKKQIDNVAQSLKEFGWVQPVVVDKDNNIIIGHCRILAAQKLAKSDPKFNSVPVVKLEELTPEEANKLRLLDNKLNESDWDMELLIEDIPELDFSGFDIDWELPELVEETEIVEDEPPEPPEEPKAKLGDIYQLGNHRLMCGDSTNADDISKLMNGDKAIILFTSPPYSDMREYNGDKDLSVNNLVKFISAYKPYTDYQCVNLGIQRKDNEIVPYWDEYIAVAKAVGYKLMAWNVWDKTMCGSIGQQKAFFPIRHEWIFVFGTEYFEINRTLEKKKSSIGINKVGKRRQTDGTTKSSSVGDTSHKLKQMESVSTICSETGSIRSLHPATFPVALPSEYILAMTNADDIVIEPFGGSGSTLIACEQLNRKCYMMELDTSYIDVIIDRWEKFTGQKAVKLN